MAGASFWSIYEFKAKLFKCLREDQCEAELARCARVHRTWTTRDESILEPIGKMSQLERLEIKGWGNDHEHDFSLPARAFLALGSLTRLKLLDIGAPWFPSCLREDDIGEDEGFSPDDKFTRADASTMLPGLTSPLWKRFPSI